MEWTQEEIATTTTHVVKGKRSKRSRVVQSLIPLQLTTNSSIGDYCIVNNNNISPPSPSSSSEFSFQQLATTSNHVITTPTKMTVTTEEDDIANCLILLAQGRYNDDNNNVHNSSRKQDRTEYDHNNNNNTNVKFSSRRFMQATNSSGKIGYYVYECKTCSRTFPSFQALGGHRASHKKPKNNYTESLVSEKTINNKATNKYSLSSDEEEEEDGNYKNLSSVSLQLSSDNNNHYNDNTITNGSSITTTTCNNVHQFKAKIHECAICGAEFTSGQALGGHMRRHRGLMGSIGPMAVANSSRTTLSLRTLPPTSIGLEEFQEPSNSRNIVSLDLDLNLPATPEDDAKLISFAYEALQLPPQQQKPSPLALTSRSLVDCLL